MQGIALGIDLVPDRPETLGNPGRDASIRTLAASIHVDASRLFLDGAISTGPSHAIICDVRLISDRVRLGGVNQQAGLTIASSLGLGACSRPRISRTLPGAVHEQGGRDNRWKPGIFSSVLPSFTTHL